MTTIKSRIDSLKGSRTALVDACASSTGPRGLTVCHGSNPIHRCMRKSCNRGSRGDDELAACIIILFNDGAGKTIQCPSKKKKTINYNIVMPSCSKKLFHALYRKTYGHTHTCRHTCTHAFIYVRADMHEGECVIHSHKCLPCTYIHTYMYGLYSHVDFACV